MVNMDPTVMERDPTVMERDPTVMGKGSNRLREKFRYLGSRFIDKFVKADLAEFLQSTLPQSSPALVGDIQCRSGCAPSVQ